MRCSSETQAKKFASFLKFRVLKFVLVSVMSATAVVDVIQQTLIDEVAQFEAVLVPFMGHNSFASASGERRVVSNFGLRVVEMAVLWRRLIVCGFDVGQSRERMLWALYFLRSYNTEEQCVSHFRPPPSAKTFRAVVHEFVAFFASMNLVRARASAEFRNLRASVTVGCRFSGSVASNSGRTANRAFQLMVSTASFNTSTRGAQCRPPAAAVQMVQAVSHRTSFDTTVCATMFACTCICRSLSRRAEGTQRVTLSICASRGATSGRTCCPPNVVSPMADIKTLGTL